MNDKDKLREEAGASRVNQAYGGELLQAISPADLEVIFDGKCEHKSLHFDNSEEFFDAIKCDDCDMIWLFDRDTIRGKIKPVKE